MIDNNSLIIQSLTLDGKAFRPSDWIDRLCTQFASFDKDKRLVYSDYICPIMYNNKRCLYLSPKLEKNNPVVYQHIISFITQHQLKTIHH